ncbi:hypothetical protein DEU56DRAFT_918347 [Suillus clintonianus]|uniref:uncharacterized protein n=1 Tax=Suillus clintonianus TaxID=1904413 RepID=UPI001B87E09A|nr:uncharacterized protein DEU56DRAFT_918347 [Suillus clintonianus]KAG2121109.1 hypothetical protein DEU56DRAFT_918347 [Suillus clintonianus]
MVTTEWTSKEQKEWLTSHLPGYSKCSSKASYAKFWPPVYEQWEEKWPIHKELWPDLPEDEALNAVQSDIMGKAVKKRQKQLRTWVSWHSARSASRKGRAAQSSVRATRLLKDLLQPRGARALSEAEMYSRLYYKTSICPSVEAAISERGSTTQGERLTIVRDMARQCWMKANKKSKKSNEDGEDDNETLEDYNEEEELTTEDLLETQENLPAIFNTILTYLAECTKFSFLVLMGGPDPSNNNTITVSSVDVGTTRLGHSAPQCLPDFKENFLGTYLRFLQGVQGNSPEPEGEDADKSEGEDEGEVEAEEHEDQDEVDADLFADEPENEVEVSKGQKGDALDREMDGKQNAQEQIPDIYSPNYAMHGSVQPEDRSTFQNINMHDPSNLAMHDGNSNFLDTTNFHSNDAYPANLSSLLFNNYNYWTPPTGQYNAFENYQTSGHVPSYPQPYNYPPSQSSVPHPSEPPVPSGSSPASSHPLDTLPPLGSSPASAHPSDTLPPLGSSPASAHPSDTLPPLGSPPAISHPSDTLPPLPPVHVANSPAPECLPRGNSQASGAKTSGEKVSSAKASGVKASGAKASKKGKPKAPAHQSETTTRKSAHPPKPSTCNETANTIGAQALTELREKENAPGVGKKGRKRGPDVGGSPSLSTVYSFL